MCERVCEHKHYFLFLQEQIKGIIIITSRKIRPFLTV
jgi:hypothetical protein